MTSISATWKLLAVLIVLCALAVLGCGAQKPQTQGVEKPTPEEAPKAPEKPKVRAQRDIEQGRPRHKLCNTWVEFAWQINRAT